MEEMLDNGIPLTTEPNALRDIVLPPSLINKMLSVAGVAGLVLLSPPPRLLMNKSAANLHLKKPPYLNTCTIFFPNTVAKGWTSVQQ